MLSKRLIFLSALLVLAVTRPCAAANIAIFGDGTFVDTAPIALGGEFESIKASLLSLGHVVTPFTGTAAANWQAALAGADVVVIPELEKGDLSAAMPADAKAVLVSYVLKGNGLVICGDVGGKAATLLNSVFGYALVTGATSGAPSALQAAAAGTAFAGGPANLPVANATTEVASASMPPGALEIYKTGAAVVFTTTVGTTGRVTYLGYDWFAQTTPPPPEWVTVLGEAVTQGDQSVGNSFRIAMFDDPTFVDAANEGAAQKAVLESMGHVVTAFSGTDEPSWRTALAGADVLVIAELEVADLLAALPTATKAAIQKFVLSGGGLLVTGDFAARSPALLNQLFGFSLAAGGAPGASSNINLAAAAGTAFAGGPAVIPGPSRTDVVTTASLPAGAAAFYTNGTQTAIFGLRRGLGRIAFSGFDWFTAGQTPWFATHSCAMAFLNQPRSLSPTAPATAAGANATVTVDLTGAAGITSAAVRFRAGGDASFGTVPLAPIGASATATIPGATLTQKGVQYFIELSDGVGVGTFPPPAPNANLNLPVTLAAQQILSLPAGTYVLGGVPIQPGNPDPVAVFDELGSYNVTEWRYGTFDGTAYHEPGAGAAPATPGQGFWIISRRAASIATAGTSTDLSENALATLHPGFNQIADPFAFPVDFADVVLPAGVQANLIAFNGTGYVSNTATLQPGQGYWIKNDNAGNVQIAIPPLGSGVAPARQSALVTAGDVGWELELNAYAGRFTDCGNLMGVRSGAAEGFDAFDLSKPPPPPAGWVRLGFPTAKDGELLADWRPMTSQGATWQVTFDSDQSGEPFRIELVVKRGLPAGWSVVAFEDSREIDLGSPPRITGRVGSATRAYTVSVGDAAYLGHLRDDSQSTVTAFSLAAPFPNPTQAGMAIDFSLPRSVPDAQVQVFDVRGRLVKTLVSGAMSRGTQRLEWNGRTTAGERATAGVYFVKAHAGAYSASRKVALLP